MVQPSLMLTLERKDLWETHTCIDLEAFNLPGIDWRDMLQEHLGYKHHFVQLLSWSIQVTNWVRPKNIPLAVLLFRWARRCVENSLILRWARSLAADVPLSNHQSIVWNNFLPFTQQVLPGSSSGPSFGGRQPEVVGILWTDQPLECSFQTKELEMTYCPDCPDENMHRIETGVDKAEELFQHFFYIISVFRLFSDTHRDTMIHQSCAVSTNMDKPKKEVFFPPKGANPLGQVLLSVEKAPKDDKESRKSRGDRGWGAEPRDTKLVPCVIKLRSVCFWMIMIHYSFPFCHFPCYQRIVTFSGCPSQDGRPSWTPAQAYNHSSCRLQELEKMSVSRSPFFRQFEAAAVKRFFFFPATLQRFGATV